MRRLLRKTVPFSNRRRPFSALSSALFDINQGELLYTLEAQVLIEEWRLDYNKFRPHSALKYRPPAPEARLH